MTIPVGLGLFFIFYVSIGFWMVAWYSIRHVALAESWKDVLNLGACLAHGQSL